jgi:hypothetical protein
MSMHESLRDEFLSEEDLDLKNLTSEELDAVWTAWLLQAQTTNDRDAREYSHGVFLREPSSCSNSDKSGRI